MTIGSSFAMDTNPPTEPVKTTVETEVVEEAQPLINYGYKDALGNCVLITTGSLEGDCLPTNPGLKCTDLIGGVNRDLYEMHFDNNTNKWVCGVPLRKP